jgi:hypothetical protein
MIEIEDGAVRATHEQGAGPHEVANAGGPPAELVQLLRASPGPAAQTVKSREAEVVNVGGPPEDLLRALGAPIASRALADPAQLSTAATTAPPATNAGAPPATLLAAMGR